MTPFQDNRYVSFDENHFLKYNEIQKGVRYVFTKKKIRNV